MMNDDMLRNIEYLREKTDITYEEAMTLLERFDGNVMRVLVELERQGRVYQQGHAGQETPKATQAERPKAPKNKTANMINKAFQHHLVVEKVDGEKKETVANLSAPYCVGATVIAPHLAVASVALMFVMGYRVRLRKQKGGNPVQMPEDVETFVDKTVSNIKKTASSLTQSVRGERQETQHDENDEEGGEITVE